MRATGERLDVQWLRVLPVDPVADAAQPREVAQALVRGGSAGHPLSLFVRHGLPRRAELALLVSLVLADPNRDVCGLKFLVDGADKVSADGVQVHSVPQADRERGH